MNELKKCPFCDGEARLQRKAKNNHGYYVVCKKCGCRTPYFQYQFLSREELRNIAITTWNTRKPMNRIAELLEDIKTKCFVTGITANPYEFGACYAMDKAIKIVKEEM